MASQYTEYNTKPSRWEILDNNKRRGMGIKTNLLNIIKQIRPGNYTSRLCSLNKKRILISAGLRLVGGSWEGEGRVEIFYNGSWGTVCDDAWDIKDARVVCRQLGFLDTVSAPRNARFGSGSGEILLDNVGCSGSESLIENCPHSGWRKHDCGHHEDASVICSSKYC